MLKVGFIGLGNVGGKLAGSLLRNGVDLTVRDLDADVAQPFLDAGAKCADGPQEIAQNVDVVITCLPSPAASAAVMEAADGILAGLAPGKIWAEMSTTDKDEVLRLGEKVRATGAEPVDCPVSGGCHRAATGNIAIFAGCERATFETMLPLLTTMGRRILHTGELGSASVLKVVTNYLATANLLSLCETCLMAKLTTVYWRDIPAQVIARERRDTAKLVLTERFAKAIDKAAMRARMAGTDAYLEQWRREEVACSRDLQAAVDAAAAELEQTYDEARLETLVSSGGLEG